MPDLRDAVSRGRYAQKQILSRSKLVAWSHARRFATALALAREFGGKRILDYGCGDGTFLALAMMGASPPSTAVGADVIDNLVEDCQRRYSIEPRMSFVHVDSLDHPNHTRQYDAVFCMEVLEHVIDWDPALARISRLLAADGTLVVTVPVEIGLPVVAKQIVRKIAGWRKIGHYPGTTPYSWSELTRAVFAGRAHRVTRPIVDVGSGPSYDHKGFNWRVLRERLERQFIVTRTLATPFSLLGPSLATQVWFVCRLREVAPQ